MNIPTQNQMDNKQKKQGVFSLSKITKKIDLLCLGQVNCNYTDFLMEYTGQSKDDNEVQNIYLKRIKDHVVFLHEWKSKEELHIVQHYDGVLFFLDLIHHLNNTTQTILKYLQTISSINGTNIFRIPIIVIGLNGSSLKSKQFQHQKGRLQRRVDCILDASQILYYSGGNRQNFEIITQKLQLFVNGIFEDDPLSIKSTWSTYYRLYGYSDLLYPYWVQIKIFGYALAERLGGHKDKITQNYRNGHVQQRNQSFIKKIW